MDSHRFDAITTSLARGVTRRRAMNAILAGAGGGAFGLLRRSVGARPVAPSAKSFALPQNLSKATLLRGPSSPAPGVA
jgi:hypothetical protein